MSRHGSKLMAQARFAERGGRCQGGDQQERHRQMGRESLLLRRFRTHKQTRRREIYLSSILIMMCPPSLHTFAA